MTALCKWAESTEPTEAALGAGVEDHRKFYFGQTNDKEYVNEYGRSVVTYADNLAEWADAAWVGSVGPFWPESVTWKWKVPDGVSVADLRDSERDLLEENRVNFMTAEYKHEYMKNGICGDGNFIDNVLGADYITHQIREICMRFSLPTRRLPTRMTASHWLRPACSRHSTGLWNCTLLQLTRRMTPACTRL